jgi:hypothetical protein
MQLNAEQRGIDAREQRQGRGAATGEIGCQFGAPRGLVGE